MMSKSLKKKAFRHYERILTHTFIRSQSELRKKFQGDFEALKNDLERMSQSLKNIVSLLEEIVDHQTSKTSKHLLLGLRVISQGLIILNAFNISDFAKIAVKCLSAVDSVQKVHSFGKMNEIRKEILRNLDEYHEVANSSSIKRLLRDFNFLSNNSTSKKMTKSMLKDEKLDEVIGAFKIPSTKKILSSFGLRIADSFSEEKINWNLVPPDLVTDVASKVTELLLQTPNEKIQKVESWISSVKERIVMIEGFIESAAKI